MAFVLADWTITRNAGNLDVRYAGDAHAGTAPTYAKTIELHRGLQLLADDEVDTGDDELSIIDKTPSDRGGADTNISLLNGCNLDDASSEHIYDGSVTQDSGDTIYDGIQVFGNSTSIQVIQNGARLINDFWNEAKMIAAVKDDLSSTTHRFLVKVRTAGADIDGRRLLGTQRVLGTGYTEFFIGGGTNRGNNVLALTANTDGNNQTAAGTIATWTDIVNDVEGFNSITIGGTAYDFYSDWELGAQSKNNFYERGKWIQREGSTETIYGLNGDLFRGITHEVDVDTPTGTFSMVSAEEITWGTGATAGVGQLLAINSATAATKLWMQLLSGVAPTDGLVITGTTSGATVAMNATITPVLVASTFIGTSTGSAINPGAYGVGIGADDLTQNDLVVDLTGTSRTPPNNVTLTVNNTVAGDYVIAGLNNSGDFNFTEMSTAAAYTTGAVTSIQMSSAIPTDIPASGTFRLELDTGSYKRVVYSSFSGDTFTIPSTDFTGVNASAISSNAFVTAIDRVATGTTETATYVYLANKTWFVRVRNATPASEIKTFETTALVGTGGGSATVGRIDDF
jgi:hypothetical protein